MIRLSFAAGIAVVVRSGTPGIMMNALIASSVEGEHENNL